MNSNIRKRNIVLNSSERGIIMGKTESIPEFWENQAFEIHTDDKEMYFSTLIEANQELAIKWPLNGKNVPLTIDGEKHVQVYYYDQLKEELYHFSSVLYPGENRKVLLKRPEVKDIKRAQRRRFFRVETGVEFLLQIPQKKINEKKLYTLDISGGGLAFLNPEQLADIDDEVQGTLMIRQGMNEKKIQFQGSVVSSYLTPKGVYKTAIEFQEMPESARSEIIKFCMAKQIELARLMND